MDGFRVVILVLILILVGAAVSAVALDIVLVVQDDEKSKFHWLVADAAAQFLWVWMFLNLEDNSLRDKHFKERTWIFFWIPTLITTVTNFAVMVVCIADFEANREAIVLARAVLAPFLFIANIGWLQLLKSFLWR